MDATTARALLATQEVVSQLMVQLKIAGTVEPDLLADLARVAADRLQPTSDNPLLEPMAKQWLATARYIEAL